jgi:hypothetical protein
MHVDTNAIRVTTGVWIPARALASATVWVTWLVPARGFRA